MKNYRHIFLPIISDSVHNKLQLRTKRLRDNQTRTVFLRLIKSQKI